MNASFGKLLILVGVAAQWFAAAPAYAATSISTMSPQIVIIDTCEVQWQRDLNFGTRGLLNTRRDRFAGIYVRCNNLLPYNIGLDAGLSAGGTTSVRQMTKGAETIDYLLFQEVARTTNWGNSVGFDTKSATADGTWQRHRIYGRVPAQTTPSPGLYTDTVTVTVTY